MTSVIIFSVVCLGLAILVIAGIALSSVSKGRSLLNDHKIPRKALRVTETDELFSPLQDVK